MIENEHMSEIARNHQYVYDKLSQAKHLLSQTKDKFDRAQKYASKKKEEMEKMLDQDRMLLITSE